MAGTALFNPNDNVTGRDGGPYLDEVEARNAEARRAVVEEREPDYDAPPATAGIPLVPSSYVASTIGVSNLPSQTHRSVQDAGDLVQARADDDEVANFHARSEIPEDFFSEPETEEVEGDVNSHDPQYGGADNAASDEEGEGGDENPEALNYDSHPPFDPDSE